MPYIITGDPNNPQPKVDYTKKDFQYNYPDGLDLKPGSKLHDALKSKIWQRANESRHEMSKRFVSWREIDKTMTVYIPLKEKEKALKSKDPGCKCWGCGEAITRSEIESDPELYEDVTSDGLYVCYCCNEIRVGWMWEA